MPVLPIFNLFPGMLLWFVSWFNELDLFKILNWFEVMWWVIQECILKIWFTICYFVVSWDNLRNLAIFIWMHCEWYLCFGYVGLTLVFMVTEDGHSKYCCTYFYFRELAATTKNFRPQPSLLQQQILLHRLTEWLFYDDGGMQKEDHIWGL